LSAQPLLAQDDQGSETDRSFWRRGAIALLLWSMLLAISLGVQLDDRADEVAHILHFGDEAALRGDHGMIAELDSWREDLNDSNQKIMLLHGFLWVAGAMLVFLLSLRMHHEAQQRKRAEQEKRENEVEFRTAMEATTVGLFRIKDMRFDYVNPAMAKMYGYSPQEFLAMSPMDIVVPEEREWIRDNTARRAAGEPGYPYEFTSLKRDGDTFHSLVWSNRILYRGKPSTVGTILDISQRIHAEKELKQAIEALAASNMELERFAYIASHDLQDPLRLIVQNSQLLERNSQATLPPQEQEYLDAILGNGRKMMSLLEDLLAFTRITSKTSPFAVVDSKDALAQALRSLRDTIEEAGALVISGRLPVVLGDASQLALLFQHLIANAVKFRRRHQPSQVHIQGEIENGQVRFSVRDNGIGIAAEHRDQIFKVFRRLHDDDSYPGTGIGLAICKRIIDRHHGRIWMEEAPGGGSEFFFTLPAVETPAQSATPTKQ